MATPPVRPALRERYDRRREELVAVAARLFAERGFHATTVGDLTSATGLAAGGLYHYVASKDELLVAICDDLMEPLLLRAREVVDADAGVRPADGTLREVVRLWVGHVAGRRHHMLVFARERQTIEGEPRWRDVRRSRKAFESLVADLVDRVGAERGAPFADPHLVVLALLGMVNHLPTWFRPRGDLRPDDIAAGFCDIVLGPDPRPAEPR